MDKNVDKYLKIEKNNESICFVTQCFQDIIDPSVNVRKYILFPEGYGYHIHIHNKNLCSRNKIFINENFSLVKDVLSYGKSLFKSINPGT